MLCDKTAIMHHYYGSNQWRRQDLLRGGTKLEIRSSGTHGGTSLPGAAAA